MTTGNAIFDTLEGAIHEFGSNMNKNELANLCIGICLDEGINTRTAIVGVVAAKGFKPQHIALMLQHGLDRHWQLNADKTYSSLN